VASGERRFEKIGCADCHVRQVAHITGIYSDLLLHDMGEALEDPVPASPRGSASYYGGADSLLVKIPPEDRREWRTPPLWGARDSAPYLHDGRARTFAEAIAWHGGEAAKSAQDFRRLEKDEQEEVLAFLNCLTAPTPESLALENIALVGDH
ncbi:MAG TPA: di-heme oxidoredictase family protein, partial [Pirellulales bacterium]|nr:di-heme oxidoredictase family protein [Pirellulales bacterium]